MKFDHTPPPPPQPKKKKLISMIAIYKHLL